MTPPSHKPLIWAHGLVTALMAALALGGIAYWVLQLSAMPQAGHDARWVDLPQSQSTLAPWGRVLGVSDQRTAAPEQAANLSLVAVISAGQGGMAVIAATGQKAQTYQVGDEVQPGRFLVQVGLRSASLGPSAQGPAQEVLELTVPALPTAVP